MVSKSQFKPRSLEYFRQIEESGETLIITDRGRPVLKYDDPTATVALEDWQALR